MVVLASLALAGCDLANKQELQYDDSRNPFYKQAQQDVDNPAAAAGDYEAALAANPKLTEAHLQLGHLYSEKLNDPISAIYHFQAYVKLAPNADKVTEVKALIEKESQSFAASLPNSPTQSTDDFARLQTENASLKKQVDEATTTITKLQAELVQANRKHHEQPAVAVAPTPSAPADPAVNPPAAIADASAPTPAVPADAAASTNAAPATPPRALPLDSTNFIASATAPPPTEPTKPSRTYTVVKGDSLWKIAHKMYPGDTKNGVDKIQEANKDVLNGKPLKIGQVLVIP